MWLGLPGRRAPGKTILEGAARRGKEPAGSRTLGKWGCPAEDVLGLGRKGSPSKLCSSGASEEVWKNTWQKGPELQRDQSSEKATLGRALGAPTSAGSPRSLLQTPFPGCWRSAQHPLPGDSSGTGAAPRTPLQNHARDAGRAGTARLHLQDLLPGTVAAHEGILGTSAPCYTPFLGSHVEGAPVGTSPGAARARRWVRDTCGRRYVRLRCGRGMWEQVHSAQIIEPGSSCPRNPIQVSIPA